MGCLFRNPGVGAASAGAAIDRAGLKNFAVGAARVSSTHANFLVVDERLNVSSSRSETDADSHRAKSARGSRDMEALISEVKARVLRDSGVVLEEEVRRVPFRFRAEKKKTPAEKKEKKRKDDGVDGDASEGSGSGSARLEPGPR